MGMTKINDEGTVADAVIPLAASVQVILGDIWPVRVL